MGLCDRCSADALVVLLKHVSGEKYLELQFCGHHARKYSPLLLDQEWVVVDDIRSKFLKDVL
jgi:hypothetical protein